MLHTTRQERLQLTGLDQVKQENDFSVIPPRIKRQKRRINACKQIDAKIPGAILRLTVSDNPYFIFDVTGPDGQIIKASIMPIYKQRPEKRSSLQLVVRWPFGDRSTPQSSLYFHSVDHFLRYLNGADEPIK